MIAVGDSVRIMAGQAKIDAVAPKSEFGMVIHRFGVQRHAREEAERFAEIREHEASPQRTIPFFPSHAQSPH